MEKVDPLKLNELFIVGPENLIQTTLKIILTLLTK